MRNIEDIAAEEDARIREVARRRLRVFLFWVGLALSLWGWNLFRQAQMDKGALVICASFIFLGAGWGLLKIFRFSAAAFALGFLAAGPLFGLYLQTRLPMFFWGKDPAFWLSVHAGAVGEPSWSPLSYLLGQAVCFIFPQRQYSILPELSSIVLAAALYWTMAGFYQSLKNKSAVNLFLCLGFCWLLGVSLPFWNVATLASGLPSSLGLLIFLWQKKLLAQDERPWDALYFLQGLLWTIHPLWGVLGLLVHWGCGDVEGRRWGRYSFPLLMGWTPFLWIAFRTGRFFPSWGGSYPWWEWVKNWKIQTPFQMEGDWSLENVLASGGWASLSLVVLAVFLWILNYFKWKAGNRSFYPAHTFWVWVLSGLGGILFFSSESQTLGSVAPAFLVGLGEMSLRLLERGEEKKHATFFSGVRLSGAVGAVLILGIGLAAFPGQHYFRSQYYFPEQHAMNLLQAAAGRSLLVCDDPFEAEACLEARIIEPLSLGAVILEKRYLNQKWYVAQCVESAPEVLFSGLLGSPEGSLKSLVLNNRDHWAVHWAVSTLPGDWKEPKSFPTVLTQEFEGSSFSPEDSEGVQYRFDLSALPKKDGALDAASAHYLSRYVAGFNDLGKKMMDQGLYMASIQAFDLALKLDPSYAEPQSLLAQMYSQQKILEAAQLEFEKTIKDHPKRISDLMSGLEQAQKNKDESKSVTLLDEMIRLNSELADAQYQLSIIYNRQGRAQESKALLESSVQLNPKQIEAQLTMGRLMSRMGNRIKAEEAFRAVLGVNPENKEAQVELWKLLNK